MALQAQNVLVGFHRSGPNAGQYYLYSNPATASTPLPGWVGGLAVDPLFPDRLIVTFPTLGRVGIVDRNGNYLGDFGTFNGSPNACAFGPDGALYVTDYNLGVQRLARGGGSSQVLPGTGFSVLGLAFNAGGYLGTVSNFGFACRSVAPMSLSANTFSCPASAIGAVQEMNIVDDGAGGFYNVGRNNTSTGAWGTVFHFSGLGPYTQLSPPGFPIHAIEGFAMAPDGMLWMSQLPGNADTLGGPSFTHGLVSLDPASLQSAYFQLPSSLSGVTVTDQVGGLAVLGQPLPRPACGTQASGFPTLTPSFSPTQSPSWTPSPSATTSPTWTSSPSTTTSFTASPGSSATPSATQVPTSTTSATLTMTKTPTSTPSQTRTATPSGTPGPSWTPSPSATTSPSWTPSPSDSPSPTTSPSATASPSVTRTATQTWTLTLTRTATPTGTPGPGLTATPSATRTGTQTMTRTATPTLTPGTPAASPSDTPADTHFYQQAVPIVVQAAYPVPANGPVSIYFTLRQDAGVDWTVFNVAGEQVFAGHYDGLAGNNVVIWSSLNASGATAASGTYLVHLHANGIIDTGSDAWVWVALAR